MKILKLLNYIKNNRNIFEFYIINQNIYKIQETFRFYKKEVKKS